MKRCRTSQRRVTVDLVAAPVEDESFDPVERWQRLLADQAGLVTRRQLDAHGFTRHALDAHLAARRWRKVLPRVYATFTGELSRSTRITASLLYAGPYAALSHRTAAEEWGILPVVDDAPVHVTVPYQSSPASQPDLVVHRSRAWRHLVIATEPPRTARADTVIDIALCAGDARTAMRTLLVTAAGANVSPTELNLRLEQRPPPRYKRALTDAVRWLAEGVGSALEAHYLLDVEDAHGIPRARRQAPTRVDGNRLLEDCDYSGVGVPLIVRLDGWRYHANSKVALRDRRRANAAELDDRPHLVFGWHEVQRDPCAVAREVIAVLRRGGWRGGTSRCARCP